MRSYFYRLMAKYIGLYVRPGDRLVELDPSSDDLAPHFPTRETLPAEAFVASASASGRTGDGSASVPDYVLLNGVLHYQRDIQGYLTRLRPCLADEVRLLVTYYSSLWKPLMRLATAFGLRTKTLELNWLDHEDIANLLELADFEPIRLDSKVLIPFRIPVLSDVVNRYVAPLPFFRAFAMVNILIARPRPVRVRSGSPAVSVIVPARNEAGNIEAIVRRVPVMGPDDEIVFVEGGSSDDTWDRIRHVQTEHAASRKIVIAQQEGTGKGDAVRTGFALATNDVLMILDADLTVPPEELPKFYAALVSGKGEFINGSRLVYPMEKRAMRFLNLVANKFFAVAFSFVLGQRFKDTLCGTKVLTRASYEKLAAHRSYFGDFDPFGDFDLIFGAARLGLRIAEMPISYRERVYGTTNISRWRHGTLLLTMLAFAGSRMKFI
jgi:hypothetical protein